MKKFGAMRKAEKDVREALAEVMGRPVVKTERERLKEEADAALQRIEGRNQES